MYRYSRSIDNNTICIDFSFSGEPYEAQWKRLTIDIPEEARRLKKDEILILKNNIENKFDYDQILEDLIYKVVDEFIIDEFSNPKLIVKAILNNKAYKESKKVKNYKIIDVYEEDLLKKIKSKKPYGKFYYSCYGKNIAIYSTPKIYEEFDGKCHEDVIEWFEKMDKMK